jgi:3-dehydroquinate synthase
MDLYHSNFCVSFDYPVVFTDCLFSLGNPALLSVVGRREPLRRHRIFTVIDRNVHAAWPSLIENAQEYVECHGDRLQAAAAPIVVVGGEAAKNDSSFTTRLYAHFAAAGMDRQSYVMVVGGGALLDAVGYAAATAHRGLRVIRVPTTVLAQNDAGVGVKNGINAFGKKNYLGTFAPPFAVLNDRRFLTTLTPRDRIAGMAEAVKAALIRDAEFFQWMTDQAPALQAGDAESLHLLIRRCAEIHLDHIVRAGDPFESGSGRPLDFGHWSAHKLEALTNYRLRHGEAVAIGLALDTLYSVELGYLDRQAGDATLALLERLGLPLWDEALMNPQLLDGLAEFREHLGGELTLTLLRDIGNAFETSAVDEGLMQQCITRLQDQSATAVHVRSDTL